MPPEPKLLWPNCCSGLHVPYAAPCRVSGWGNRDVEVDAEEPALEEADALKTLPGAQEPREPLPDL